MDPAVLVDGPFWNRPHMVLVGAAVRIPNVRNFDQNPNIPPRNPFSRLTQPLRAQYPDMATESQAIISHDQESDPNLLDIAEADKV